MSKFEPTIHEAMTHLKKRITSVDCPRWKRDAFRQTLSILEKEEQEMEIEKAAKRGGP